MIISDGHAKALLRTLVRSHSARAQDTVRALGRSLAALPEKRTRLAAFVEKLRGRLATDALLVSAVYSIAISHKVLLLGLVTLSVPYG